MITDRTPSSPESGAGRPERAKEGERAPGRPVAEQEGAQPGGRPLPPEVGGQKGPEPTRYGDWEKGGRCTDF